MSPAYEGRPGVGTEPTEKTQDREDQEPDDAGYYDPAAAMRRRRAASYRLPPLAGGRGRDPWDLVPPPDAARCELSITIDRERDVALVCGWMDGETITDAGHQPRWSQSAAGWVIDAEHVGDVLAEAVRQRRIVQVHDATPQPLGAVS